MPRTVIVVCLLILPLAVLFVLKGTHSGESRYPAQDVFEIGKINLKIPNDLDVKFIEGRLGFILDADTFEGSNRESAEAKRKTIKVYIADIDAEVGGARNIWPDPLKGRTPLRCDMHDEKGKLCYFGNIGREVLARGEIAYAVIDPKSGMAKTLIGCLDPKMHSVPNPLCAGQGIAHETLHISYNYSVKHERRAFEIDAKIREIIDKMLSDAR